MSDLKKQAEELGIQVDGRWSDAKIQAMIDEKLAAEPESVDESQALAEPAEPEPEPEPEPDGAVGGLTFPLDKEAVDAAEVTITSLIENPMKVFGLRGIGDTTKITVGRLRDERFAAKLVRAEEMGMIRLEEHE